jgi:phage-related baseplate assembly protein
MFASVDTDIPRFSIGKDVVRDRLASGLDSINGVKRIVWSSPAADVEIPSDGLAELVAWTCKPPGWTQRRPAMSRFLAIFP